jgi:hypothetical protein
MADPALTKRRLLGGWGSGVLLVLGWAFALFFFNSRAESFVHHWLNDAIYRIFSGFLGASEIAHRVLETSELAFAMGLGLALFVGTFTVPLGFVARMVARARVRAGNRDPLDRVRGWLAARRGRTAAVVAVLPAVAQALFIRSALDWWGWSPVYFAVFAVLGGLAQLALVRGGLRALLAPTVPERGEGTLEIGPDELRFDAVAVTRETRAAVGALAVLTLGVASWLAMLPILALFRDPRVFSVIGVYVAVAAGSAIVFRKASRIAVGVDGIYVGGTSRARFYAYRDLDTVRVRGGDVELVKGDRVVLRLQLHGEDAARRDAILARIHEALARVKVVARDAAANFVTSRSGDKVAQSARGGGDYRMPSVSPEALWSLVEGQAVDAPTRTAAAEALVRTGGAAERERLRVAAAHCADPRIRVALEELASDEDVEDEAAGPGRAAERTV